MPAVTTIAEHDIHLIITDPHLGLVDEEVRFPIAHGDDEPPTIGVSHVGAFPQKQVIGDWTQASNQVMSSLVQSSWIGGGQVSDSQESSDTDRYSSIASLETRFVRSLTLLPKATKIVGPNTNRVQMLGDLVVGHTRQTYVSFGDQMRRVEGVNLTTPKTLAGTPTSEGACFRVGSTNTLFIPLGTTGYQTWDGTTLSSLQTSFKPLNFAIHSRKIWAVDIDGNIANSLNGSTWTTVWQVDPAHLIRSIFTYIDRTENPAIHVMTDDALFALDEGVPALYETELTFPPTAHTGVAIEKWRTDLYASMGLGIMRYTLGTINAAGLDRDDSVGLEFSGFVSNLERGFNDLFASIDPFLIPSEVVEEFRAEHGLEVYLSSASATATIMRQNGGGGWHTAWMAPQPGGSITTLMACSNGDDYRLYWGWNGDLYFQDLNTDFDNPKHSPVQEFESSGQLISSWFDMGMAIDRMTLAAINLRVKDASPTRVINVDYQIDSDDVTNTWRQLAEITEPGYHIFRAGENGVWPTQQDVPIRYDGVGFGRIRYRIRMRATDGRTPDIESIVIAFIKRMRRVRSFEVAIDCSADVEANRIYGMSNEQRRQVLQRLIDSETFVPFLYKQEWIETKMSFANGPEGVGTDSQGDITITLLESWERPEGA